MKKMILSLMGATFACTTFAANCVSVTQVSTDYAGHQITIALTRSGCTDDATNHRNTAWVFVDYREAGGSTWARATIGAASAGTVVNSGSSKGVWINGANGLQTVTLTLSGMPAKYDWCAFATDYPPQLIIHSAASVVLTGTAPFTVRYTDNTVDDHLPAAGYVLQAGKTPAAVTDATAAAGNIQCVTRDQPAVNGYCCAGQTVVGGYCRDLVADNAIKVTGCGAELEVEKTARLTAPGAAYSVACPAGWRTATIQEYSCIWRNYGTGSGMSAGGWYMSNQSTTSGHWVSVSPCRSCVAYWSYVPLPHGFVNGTCGAVTDAVGGIMYPQCRDGMGAYRHYKCLR